MELARIVEPRVLAAQPNEGIRPWVREHRAELFDALQADGAVLVRGLEIGTAAQLAVVASGLEVALMPEREQFAARHELGDGVYSASEWSPAQAMCPHHEQSYRLEVPGLLLFGHLSAADSGGELTVTDSVEVLRRLPDEVVRAFERSGWQVLRNYSSDYIGLPWRDAFGTTDRGAVEQYCQDNDIRFEWRPDDRLRTTQVRPATLRHPRSGAKCWFNQAAFLNAFSLDPVVREVLTAAYGPDGLPFDTRFGDGSEIPGDLVRLINETCVSAETTIAWQEGDLVLVDNIRTAHGRTPYEGPRRVATALAQPLRVTDL